LPVFARHAGYKTQSMMRIKFLDLHPFQDATKIEARLMAALRR
jgi:hypothetical protein